MAGSRPSPGQLHRQGAARWLITCSRPHRAVSNRGDEQLDRGNRSAGDAAAVAGPAL